MDDRRRKTFFVPALAAMFAAACGLPVAVFADFQSAVIYPGVVSWLLLTFTAFSMPPVYYWYRGRFDLFNPIILAAWSYFIPVFGVGGLIFTSGYFQPFYTYLIQDPKNDVPQTFIYIISGFLSLWAGYEISAAYKIADYLQKKIPDWDWDLSQLILPGYLLLLIGVLFNVTTFAAGIMMGYQTSTQVEALDNFQYFLSLIILVGAFLLWMVIFKTKKRHSLYYITLVVLILIAPLRALLLGNRGSLFQTFVMITMAYFFSGNVLNFKKSVVVAGFLVAAIFVGMIWGTTFRRVKGNESRISTGEYVETVGNAFDAISSKNVGDNALEALDSLSERLENFSALAVVVSNYEKLEPYEEAYGLKNNIWTYTWTAFIPRIVWQNKPIVSDARAYSELYFNYGDNSFPITPMGDLLRNFGPFGVPVGMFALGLFLRFLYGFLIENKTVTPWRGVVYFMLITKVSYEGFYGTIFPDIIRTVFILLLCLLLINFTARKTNVKVLS